jgi:hypothetical protein
VAVGRDAKGDVVAIAPAWTVVSAGGVIDSAGLLTAGSTAGSFVVSATSGFVSGIATMTINAGALATITVTVKPATVALGARRQLTAVGKDATGNVVTISPIWSVAAGGGTIGFTGLFTAGAGTGKFTSTVTATSGTISGAATIRAGTAAPGPVAMITVTPNPASVAATAKQRFTAVATDAAGNVVFITPGWRVAGGGGTISTAGLFTAGAAAGTFTNSVTAASGATSGTATVTVTATSSLSVKP